jgi:hypothetical protein
VRLTSRQRFLRLVLTLGLLAATSAAAAAPPAWTWSRVPRPPRGSEDFHPDTSGVRVHAIAPAPEGGVLVAGTAWGRISVAPVFSLRSVEGARREHAFLMRLSPQGETVWIKRMGTRETGDARRAPPGGVTALAVDGAFNVVMAGAFEIEGPRGKVRTATLAGLTPSGKVSWALALRTR